MKTRSADITWTGRLRDGSGEIELESGALSGPYNYDSRFEEGETTNPEELIGGALAGCFTMAFAAELERAGHEPEDIATNAAVTLDTDDLVITGIELTVEGSAEGIDAETFQEIAEAAKEGCPVSKALAGTDISVSSTLTE